MQRCRDLLTDFDVRRDSQDERAGGPLATWRSPEATGEVWDAVVKRWRPGVTELAPPDPNPIDKRKIRAEARALHLVTTSNPPSKKAKTQPWQIGDRAFIPASEWPDETGAEFEGGGWEVEVEDVRVTKKGLENVLVSFVYARDPAGKQFERQLMKASVLRPLSDAGSAIPRDRHLPERGTATSEDEENETPPAGADEGPGTEAPDLGRQSSRVRKPIKRYDPVAMVSEAWAPFDQSHQSDAGLLREAKLQAPLSISDTRALAKELEWGPNRQLKVDEIEACRQRLETPGVSEAAKDDWVLALKKGRHDDLRLWSPPRGHKKLHLGGIYGCERPPASQHPKGSFALRPCPGDTEDSLCVIDVRAEDLENTAAAMERCREILTQRSQGGRRVSLPGPSLFYQGPKGMRRRLLLETST